MGLKVLVLGIRIYCAVLRVYFYDFGHWVQGLKSMVYGLGFRVKGLGLLEGQRLRVLLAQKCALPRVKSRCTVQDQHRSNRGARPRQSVIGSVLFPQDV